MNRSCPSLWSSIPTAWVATGVRAWAGMPAAAREPAAATGWIFIDLSLQDAHAWLATLQGEVVYLDPSRDGLRQIAEWLHGTPGVQRVHILSKGVCGRLPLGASLLDPMTLCDEHDEAMAVIAGVLAADAALHLHGFDPDEGASGGRLLEAMAAVLGVDVRVHTQAPRRDEATNRPGCVPMNEAPVPSPEEPHKRREWLATDARMRAALLSVFQSAASEPVDRMDPRAERVSRHSPLGASSAETSRRTPLAHC